MKPGWPVLREAGGPGVWIRARGSAGRRQLPAKIFLEGPGQAPAAIILHFLSAYPCANLSISERSRRTSTMRSKRIGTYLSIYLWSPSFNGYKKKPESKHAWFNSARNAGHRLPMMKLSFVINAGPGYLRLSRKNRTFSASGAGRKPPMTNPLFVTNADPRYKVSRPLKSRWQASGRQQLHPGPL